MLSKIGSEITHPCQTIFSVRGFVLGEAVTACSLRAWKQLMDVKQHIYINCSSFTMQEEEAKRIFCQLMDGVEFCHMNNIFHRYVEL